MAQKRGLHIFILPVTVLPRFLIEMTPSFLALYVLDFLASRGESTFAPWPVVLIHVLFMLLLAAMLSNACKFACVGAVDEILSLFKDPLLPQRTPAVGDGGVDLAVAAEASARPPRRAARSVRVVKEKALHVRVVGRMKVPRTCAEVHTFYNSCAPKDESCNHVGLVRFMLVRSEYNV